MIDKLGLDGLGGASVRKPEAVNKLTALIEVAKAASVLDHNENAGWYGVHAIENAGAYYRKNARFIAECDPATILELCALLKKAEEALQSWANTINYQYTGSREAMTHLQECDGQGQEALAAIKQWKEGT
jgi:hypothetical protein